MNPLRSAIYRYSIPLLRPLPVRGGHISNRDGLILELSTPDGTHRSYGEIAPLPGLHDETLPEALEQLRNRIEEAMVDIATQSSIHKIPEFPGHLMPSVRTGLEMAACNLQASIRGTFPLPEATPSLVPLNALVYGNPGNIEKQALEHYSMGYRSFKFKVTNRDADTVAEQIRLLDAELEKEVEFRLDSNQSFDLDSASRFLETLPKQRISYIEEPLGNPRDIQELHARTGIRIALDETLWQSPDIRHHLPESCLGAYVLKPSRIGGILATIRLIQEAEQRNIPPIISSAFESGISLGFYALLCTTLRSATHAAGLDTFRQLGTDIISAALETEHGCIPAARAWEKSTRPNMQKLKKIDQWTL
ncbi:o-succinylbenzoate synthase [Prosthecochloris sp. CIB 2401]|uniref:o-succinylbenzoate synthase n=1 Tax=Prosthecochloris sp. CIB 2401 TaxID=1868325 RepID=UPI00083A8552|nr:o-succinylbenzoate synthase [Prosthecochloris sp. CIB 2401]